MQKPLGQYNRALDSFDEDLVTPVAASVHGQFHSMANHRVDEFMGSKMAAWVGFDDVWFAEPGIRFLQRLYRMHGLQRDRHSVRLLVFVCKM